MAKILLLHLFSLCCFILCLEVVSASENFKAEMTDLPLYWGWFLETDYSSSFLSRSQKLLADTLQAVPEFFNNVKNFTNQEYISDILLYYTRENFDEVLHCTAMFNGVYPNYTVGAEEYAEQQIVKDNINQPSTLHAIGWVLTPRTFGARIKLTKSQLQLWNQNDTEGNPQHQKSNVEATKRFTPLVYDHEFPKENTTDQDPDVLGNFQPTAGFGSKAHLTLGCSPGVEAVTTGYDLVDLIRLEGLNSSDVETYDLPGGGWLRNYGDGQWVFYPTKQWLLESTFLGYGKIDNGSHPLLVSFSLLCITCAIAIMSMLPGKM